MRVERRGERKERRRREEQELRELQRAQRELEEAHTQLREAQRRRHWEREEARLASIVQVLSELFPPAALPLA